MKIHIDPDYYKEIENNLGLSKTIIDASIDATETSLDWLDGPDKASLAGGEVIRSEAEQLQILHGLLRDKDPFFTNLGLIRVINEDDEFIWVHPLFVKEYVT